MLMSPLRDEKPVAEEFRQTLRAIDADAQLRCLRRLPKQRDLIEGSLLDDARRRLAFSDQWTHADWLGLGNAFRKVFFLKLVHEEADSASMHAVDRLLILEALAERFQHVSIAAEGDDHVCLVAGFPIGMP